MRDIGLYRGAHGVRFRLRVVKADDVDLILEIDEAIPKSGRMNQRETDLGNSDLFHLGIPFRIPGVERTTLTPSPSPNSGERGARRCSRTLSQYWERVALER